MEIAVQKAKVMTSREVAELTGKEMSNIHRDIRTMLVSLYGEEHVARIVPEKYRNRHSEFIRENAETLLSAIAGDDSKRNHQDDRGFSWERDTRGYIVSFSLDKAHTMTLISGYNVKLRKAIIDRWQALESAPTFLIPQSLPDALRLAADLADQRNAAQAALAIAKPKAEALDLIATADGMVNLQTAGKVLQQKPNKFIQWLRENGWIYKRAGSAQNSARAEKFNAGLLSTKACTVVQPDGTDRVREQVMVTAKGLSKLALMLGVQVQTGIEG